MTRAHLAPVVLLTLACGESLEFPDDPDTGAAGSTTDAPTTGGSDYVPGDPWPVPPSCDVDGQGGQVAWSLLQDGLSGEIADIGATPDGAIVVAGMIRGNHTDAYVQVRERTGALVWSDQYAGAHGLNDDPMDVAVDSEGFIHVLVREAVSEIHDGDWVDVTEKLVVLRYAPDGTHVWRLERPPVGPVYSAWGSITSFADKTVLLEARGDGSSDFSYGLMSLDRLGNIRSTIVFENPGWGFHAVDADGSHCFAGERSLPSNAVFVRCFTPDGDLRWNRIEPGTDQVDAIVIGRAHEVYVARYNYASETHRLLRYGPDGDLEWHRSLPQFTPLASVDVVMRCDGSLLVVGSMSDHEVIMPWVARYDTQGHQLWSFQHDFEPPEHVAFGARIVATPTGDAAIVADYVVEDGNKTYSSTLLGYVSD